MFEFTEGNKGEITANYFARENHFRAIPVVASLHMDARILEIHGFLKFVRQSGSKASDHAFLSSYRAEFPNGNNTYPLAYYLNDSTFFLRIPDFEDEQAELLVKAHWKEIISRPFLIVDIRNNGGGLDDFFQSLLSLVYTNPYNVTGVEWYASEGNIRNSEEAINSGDVRNGEEGIKWLKELVDAMKKNPGGFVLHPEMGGDAIEKRDTIYPYPRKVGIIINEGNGSAAEQFILEAKESKKVILFGNHNTAGVLDYSNRVQEDFPSGNYLFFWPMTRSMRLPDHPIDNIGISPDVNIPFPETDQLYGRLDDWVYFVKEYLEFNEK
jgi:C-terminal processing protease CtpA/Prc